MARSPQESGPSSPPSRTVRVTGDDLRARAHRDKMHVRLLVVAAGFFGLFSAVAVKLSIATVFAPMAPESRQIAPQVPKIPQIDPKGSLSADFSLPQVHRASVIDRNGQTLALSLPVAQVYANPQELIDPQDVAKKLQSVLHDLNLEEVTRRLSLPKQFVYIARNISPQQEMAINNLGIPGIYFEQGERRRYPLGRTAAHIIGAVDIDDHGIAGVERYFNTRLMSDRTPLRLSLDVRVQSVVRDELAAAMATFQAIGACAIVMDVHTGEIIAMVSLPDFDANDFVHAKNDEHFNRAVTGLYEPGSTFKLQTAAMGLQTGTIHIWDRFSSVPIHVGRFKISDMKSDHFTEWLSLPEVMAYSSNPAAAHIALDVGAVKQAAWMKDMGFFAPVPIELPEAARPLVPHHWSLSTTMTVGFGHGIAESPLAIVRGTAATVNGGILIKPTLLEAGEAAESVVKARNEAPAADANLKDLQSAAFQQALTHAQAQQADSTADNKDGDDPQPTPQGKRVISEQISALLRRLLRLDVTKGTGKTAESPGYFVGGKTGTAEKIGPHGGYLKHTNISAFTSIFPMNAPRYAVYVMLDSPKPTPETHGWTTAGWNAAPTVSKIITRIGPMLQIFPDTAHAAEIDAGMALPMHPTPPRGVRPLGPGNDPGDPRKAEAARKAMQMAEKRLRAQQKKQSAEVMDE